jgi:DNA-directed RNA polymerase beta subunit
LRKNNPYTL